MILFFVGAVTGCVLMFIVSWVIYSRNNRKPFDERYD